MNITDELAPLINGWFSDHPKYGPLDEALKHRGIIHSMLIIDNAGLVYALTERSSIAPTNKIRYNPADPQFFEKITDIIEKHIMSCDICNVLV